jgi:hypothetical protein
MAREVATAYTGANVSITIGANLITNAFGISYELSQNKRPVYGYNSLYFDAVASGQVIVLGQLYLNFQHPNYLSKVLSDYYNRNLAKGRELTGMAQSLGPLIMSDTAASYTEPLKSGLLANNAKQRQEASFSTQLDQLHNDPLLAQTLGKTFGVTPMDKATDITRNFKIVDGKVYDAFNGGSFDAIAMNPRNMNEIERRDGAAVLARPDNFTNNEGIRDPINIVITYGDPGLNDEKAGIMSYMPSTSIILRGVHFIGEAQQVMADDQPVMETYKFMARSKQIFTTVHKAEE